MERTDFEQWKAKEVARLLALVETERRYYQEMVASLPVPLLVLSADTAVVWANRAFRRQFGLRAEALRRRNIDQILPIEGLTDLIREAHQEGAQHPEFTATVQGLPMRIAAIPIQTWDDESGVETLLMLEPIPSAEPAAEGSPQQMAPPEPEPDAEPAQEPEPLEGTPPDEPEPARSESGVRLPDNYPAVVWTADAETLEFTSVGGFAEELLGYPVSHWLERGDFFEERMYADDRAATLALFRSIEATGGDATAEFRCVSANGQLVWCRESIRVSTPGAQPATIQGVLTKIDRRRQFEQHLVLGSRMEALQEFSGRLAHGLNNPLMIATGYGEEILDGMPQDNPARADMAEIIHATGRISGLAAQLTELARRHANPPTRIELGDEVSANEMRLAEAAGAGVMLELIASPEPVWAAADQDQLGEVLAAVADRARAGAEERTRLTISWDVDVVRERTYPEALKPGRYARITVRDDGRGLEEHKQVAIFDPVIPGSATDSPESGEAGLALARAYYLVRQWGGSIAFTSEPFRGSTFSIYLPYIEPEAGESTGLQLLRPEAVEEPAPEEIVIEAEPEPEPEPMRETVLVVDDEAGIRGLMRKILNRERYQVIEAGSAEEALESVESHNGPIDLLLTDVVLPGMSGPDLARQMFQAQPGLRVLYISGYTQDESIKAGEDPPGAKFLAKPFTLGALLGMVRETLEG